MILCLNEHFSHFSVKAWTTSLTSRDEEHACFTFKFERGADNSGINAGIKVPVCARLSCKHVCSLQTRQTGNKIHLPGYSKKTVTSYITHQLVFYASVNQAAEKANVSPTQTNLRSDFS